MAGAVTRSSVTEARKFSKRCRRPIPKRGKVKVAIVLGLAHSFACIFSRATSHLS